MGYRNVTKDNQIILDKALLYCVEGAAEKLSCAPLLTPGKV